MARISFATVAAAALASVALAANSVRGGKQVRDWSAVDAVLEAGVTNSVYPGCSAAVMDATGNVVYTRGVGQFTYGEAPPLGGPNLPVTTSTLYDMASLTKILGATSATAILYERGYINLKMLVSDPSLLGPAYAVNGKDSITIADCLLHQAGYPPDPVPSYDSTEFGCPATSQYTPPETFSCSERIFASLLNQTLQYPTGTSWLYSDLSMITMQYVLGTIISRNQLVAPSDLLPSCAGADPTTHPGLYRTCYFEAFVRVHVLRASGMNVSQFLPPPDMWPNATPTWQDPVYRHETVQGQVSDENAYALGGIAGHAGVFSSAQEMVQWVGMWAYGVFGAGKSPYASLINATTQHLFFTAPDPTFSPRALGWVTQAATDTYQGCGNFSAQTAYHTGYTGTLVCIDPTSGVSLVLLTNRVYPNKTDHMLGIQLVRQQFANAVLDVLGA